MKKKRALRLFCFDFEETPLKCKTPIKEDSFVFFLAVWNNFLQVFKQSNRSNLKSATFFNYFERGRGKRKIEKSNPPVISFCITGSNYNTKNRQSKSSACKSMTCLLKCLDLDFVCIIWYPKLVVFKKEVILRLVYFFFWTSLYSKPFWKKVKGSKHSFKLLHMI